MGLFENKIKQFPKIFDWVERLDVSRLSNFLLDNERCLNNGARFLHLII